MTNMELAVRELQLREASEQSVLAEVTQVLEFARDFFAMRGRTILATQIGCQLEFFAAAEVFDKLDEHSIVPTKDVA